MPGASEAPAGPEARQTGPWYMYRFEKIAEAQGGRIEVKVLG
jgi:hypothetical protein